MSDTKSSIKTENLVSQVQKVTQALHLKSRHLCFSSFLGEVANRCDYICTLLYLKKSPNFPKACLNQLGEPITEL